MTDEKRSRFVSYGLQGVSITRQTNPGLSLLDGRKKKIAGKRHRLDAASVGPLTKSGLVVSVAERSGLTRRAASKVVEGVFEAIGEALKNGDEVRVVGFGTFSVAKRKASMGRNPRTGKKIKVKEMSQPKFKPGKELREAVEEEASSLSA